VGATENALNINVYRSKYIVLLNFYSPQIVATIETTTTCTIVLRFCTCQHHENKVLRDDTAAAFSKI